MSTRQLRAPDTNDGVTIRLVGPGGAGKTTIGAALAVRLGVPFIDLDHQFTARFGDISTYLARYDYQSYASRNVQLSIELTRTSVPLLVMALSSGFMTYPPGVHPDYGELCRAIAASPSTVVLLPSFDIASCVAETVRRQAQRPFGRGASREEEVIRARFDVHRALAARQFETMRGVHAIVENLAALFAAREGTRR
jgi:shikimate kinase